ncbi:putative NADP-dependent oxidoreductase YfmJ [Gracilariopsis chorda]|uniref:Putative NADP-dependent oxidoreductase YfmJ n=1 Tax=Gracilariopsis chorda TaxID=448386 RepID=A0A2V3J6X1_9FLOR|nr:putative NADP-dependent oxidoreductase YfmJ [Gracilariopsis chorda]|eukprot:PXF50155.1 putative NADP-dependent oxidoreductase YfmJ [Gracilariopsis chorda]
MVGFFSDAKPAELPKTSLQVFLTDRPTDHITDDTFATRCENLPRAEEFPPGHILVKVLYVSCDPAMRGWLSTRKSYIEPVAIGATMRAMGVGKVLRGAAGFRSGQLVTGPFGWTEYCLASVKRVTRAKVPSGMPVSAALGVLGTTGMTAYFGLLHIGKPKRGEVVLVSAAAGATGSVVAQIAKNVLGCEVIGIAGGVEKCRYLEKDLGIKSVDYKSEEGIDRGLKRALNGKGIDVYFDNVGGSALEAALRRINIGARIVVCGAISGYNSSQLQPGPRNYVALISKRASMTGFLLYDFEKQFPKASYDLSRWLVSGKLKVKEYKVVGLRNAPSALQALFQGKNIGKVVVQVFEDGNGDGEQGGTGRRTAKL